MIGGKRMWKWADVDAMLSGQNDRVSECERIKDATRRLMRGTCDVKAEL
jgi:hypothetical protein